MAYEDSNSSDKFGYQSPPASIDPDPTPWGPFNKRKIPLDENHICPCCDGKGYVGIVKETDVVPNAPRVKKNRDILGKLIP